MHKWIKAVHRVAWEVSGTVQYGYRAPDAESDCVGIVCEDAAACVAAAKKLELLDASVDSTGPLHIVYWPWLTGQPVDNS